MQYVVQPGDSPWTIAWRFTGRSTRWGELVACNPHKPRARDGNFLALSAGEVLTLPPGWPAPAHGRSSLAVASSPARYSPSSDAGAPLEERPPRPLETSNVTELVKWAKAPPHRGGGEYTTDLRYWRTAKNHNPDSEWWSDRAWDAWIDMADAVKADPETLLLVAYSESGNTLAPWIVGPNKKGEPFAWGLFQITPIRDTSTGLSKAECDRFRAQNYVPHTAEQQIPYLRRYLEVLNKAPEHMGGRGGKGFAGLGPGVFYAYNFMPANVRSGEDSVILVSKNPEDKDSRYPQLYWPKGYEENASLDANRDGRITIGELGALLEPKRRHELFRLAKKRLDEALARRGRLGPGMPVEAPPRPSRPLTPSPSPVPVHSTAPSGGAGALLLLAGAAWLLWDQG